MRIEDVALVVALVGGFIAIVAGLNRFAKWVAGRPRLSVTTKYDAQGTGDFPRRRITIVIGQRFDGRPCQVIAAGLGGRRTGQRDFTSWRSLPFSSVFPIALPSPDGGAQIFADADVLAEAHPGATHVFVRLKGAWWPLRKVVVPLDAESAKALNRPA